jgi:ParB family transcriptional regulator, chromosome partitioning protein
MEMELMKDPGPRKVLGRGLAALIPSAAPTTPQSPGYRVLPIERVQPTRTQPRKTFDEAALEELAASIKKQGVLQPIVVRRRGDSYEIVAGERRWRAASRAGLHEVPAIVKELSDGDALQIALIENIQRQDLDPLEEAAAYGRLLEEYGFTQEQLAEAVGKNRATIANSLRLMKLPQIVQELLATGQLTAGHARALMTLEDESRLVKLAREVVERRLSVRETEHLARGLVKKPKAKSAVSRSPAVANVEDRLQRSLGTKVRLAERKGKGKIEIFFHSLEELDRLLEAMAR